MITFTISIISSFIVALTAIAFFTLLERKMLGYSQLRKGPNKVRIIGVPQPIADALKLFSKAPNNPTSINYLLFILTPIVNLILALLL